MGLEGIKIWAQSCIIIAITLTKNDFYKIFVKFMLL